MSFRQRQFAKRFNRRLVCLAVLFAVCASFVPLPIGTQVTQEKDQSQPYPCQHRPCGCKSAEQCWKSCCCFTNVQKIAWARQHKVTLPAFVVEAAKKEQAEQDAEKTVDVAKSPCKHCCQKQAVESPTKPACCSAKVVKTCCQPTKNSSDNANTSQNTKPSRNAGKSSPVVDETIYVIGIEMQKCKGFGSYWNSLPWAIMPPAERPIVRVIPDHWERPESVPVTSQVQEPPEPPPRLS